MTAIYAWKFLVYQKTKPAKKNMKKTEIIIRQRKIEKLLWACTNKLLKNKEKVAKIQIRQYCGELPTDETGNMVYVVVFFFFFKTLKLM